MESLKRLAQKAPFGNGRVKLGVAFDGWFLPRDTLTAIFTEIKKMGIRHFTTHNSPSPPGT
jgi:hypothetical protein